jgi:hypothetical protein
MGPLPVLGGCSYARRRLKRLKVACVGDSALIGFCETTKEGDISQTGRNSRPLAASSKPVGGFYFNRAIVDELLKTYVPSSELKKVRKGVEQYLRWRAGTDDLTVYSEDYRTFIRNFHSSIYRVENPKLSLCRTISDWRLDAALDSAAAVMLPRDPFSAAGPAVNLSLSASRVKRVNLPQA